MELEEKFSDDPEENFRIENELMKIRLQAQYGDAFRMETNAAMPPAMENQFLKNVLAFEESYENADLITIYERIGKPEFLLAEKLDSRKIKVEIQRLLELLNQHGINLDFSDGPYEDAVIYRFITEELFNEEVSSEPVEGMITGFIYEEFHPNHEKEIERNTHLFLKEWFTRGFREHDWILSDEIITADGVKMQRGQLLEKLRLFFGVFEGFANDGYNIDKISFELQPENDRGLGFAEGMLKYDAEIENNEIIHFEGPYKLYMQMEYNQWDIFYFVMPGFKW